MRLIFGTVRRVVLLAAFVGFALSASAQETNGTTKTIFDKREVFYGTWGTPKQCARKPHVKGGTVLAEPFVISRQWLKQGRLYCSLNWGPLQKREKGAFTAAHAQCGEDSIRGYFLGFEIVENNLTIAWDFPHKNGPLARCPVS